MARLPVAGVTLRTPEGDLEKLEQVLSQLNICHAFDEPEVQALRTDLARVVGMWAAEAERIELAVLAGKLRSLGRNLVEASTILESGEGGLQRRDLFETSLQLQKYLALEPAVGTVEKARERLAAFADEAAKIGDACMVAASGLESDPGERGRAAHQWYNLFTSILLDLAARAKVKPTLGRNGTTGEWRGWLLEAAQSFETLLPRDMRSPSAEACAKRLNRSRGRIRHGQI
jgi:hypothetical protein